MTANQGILEALQNELTKELVGRLVAYCAMKAARRLWYGLLVREDPSLAEGQQSEDIVQTVIAKTIAGAVDGPGKGRRIWDGRRTLYDYFTSQIDSELNNLGRSWVNQKFRRASQMERISDDGHQESFFESVADEKTENPEEIALREEVEAAADDFVSGFLDVLGDDDFLVAVVGQIIDGVRKPREIAAALNVRVDEVYKARKRLRRRLGDYYAARLDIEPIS